jgi:hypothetical protein
MTYELDDQEIGFYLLQRQEIFLFCLVSTPGLGHTKLTVHWTLVALSPEIKQGLNLTTH